MYLDFEVEIPVLESGISKKRIKGTTYIYYEYDRKYYSDKQYTVPQCTSIGKMCEDNPSMMNPNENYLKFFPNVNFPDELPVSSRSGTIKVGAWLVIRKTIEHYGLLDRIEGRFGKDSGLLLDLAACAIVTEDNEAQYYPDYAYTHPLFAEEMKVYSDSRVSEFLRDISRDDSVRFQNEWNAGRDHSEKIYISYESANKQCQAGDVELVECGVRKNPAKGPIFNYSIAYDKDNQLPLFYEAYPGSTEDASQFRFVLEKAAEYGYKDAGFILDRGLFSDLNIKYMDAKGYEFVIVANGCKELVRDRILEVCGSFENKKENAIPFYDVSGITIMDRAFPKDEKKRYVHIYYSDYRNATERTKLQTVIREQKEYLESLRGSEVNVDERYETYFDLVYHVESPGKRVLKLVEEKRDVISRDIKLCGYFGIITSAEMTAAEAIALYRNRDGTERLFRGDKAYLGGKCEMTYYDEPTHSKIFVEFVALIMRNRIYSCLMERMKEIRKKRIYMTVPAAIRELDKIELTRQPDGVYRLDHAVTATQKDILQAFGLTAASVKKEADELGGQLGSVTS